MFHLWTKRKSDNYVISTTELLVPDLNDNWFETMIYNELTNKFLDFQERYKTCSQALNGHIRTIRHLDEILYEEEHKNGNNN